jgi:general stress protein 26
MIVGHMEVLVNEEIKTEIWREGDAMYYPLGVNDPDYCVLKFTGHKIRTYHDFRKEDISI